jgi:hypothetical protein
MKQSFRAHRHAYTRKDLTHSRTSKFNKHAHSSYERLLTHHETMYTPTSTVPPVSNNLTYEVPTHLSTINKHSSSKTLTHHQPTYPSPKPIDSPTVQDLFQREAESQSTHYQTVKHHQKYRGFTILRIRKSYLVILIEVRTARRCAQAGAEL